MELKQRQLGILTVSELREAQLDGDRSRRGMEQASCRCDVADHIVKVIIIPESGDQVGSGGSAWARGVSMNATRTRTERSESRCSSVP